MIAQIRTVVFCLVRQDDPPHRKSVEHSLELIVPGGIRLVQALQRMLTILVTLKYWRVHEDQPKLKPEQMKAVVHGPGRGCGRRGMQRWPLAWIGNGLFVDVCQLHPVQGSQAKAFADRIRNSRIYFGVLYKSGLNLRERPIEIVLLMIGALVAKDG
jgi:hypothetical protein